MSETHLFFAYLYFKPVPQRMKAARCRKRDFTWYYTGTVARMHTDIVRSVQMHTDIVRSVQMHTDIVRSVQIMNDGFSVTLCGPDFKYLRRCWWLQLFSLQMPVPAPGWDSIVSFGHEF